MRLYIEEKEFYKWRAKKNPAEKLLQITPLFKCSFNKTLTSEEQDEVSDFITFIISKRKKNAKPRASLRHFAGLVSDDEAKVMLQASEECRKTENSIEW